MVPSIGSAQEGGHRNVLRCASAHFVPLVAAVSSSWVVVHLQRDNAASSPVWPCVADVDYGRYLLVLDPDFMALFTWAVNDIPCPCMSSILSLKSLMLVTIIPMSQKYKIRCNNENKCMSQTR